MVPAFMSASIRLIARPFLPRSTKMHWMRRAYWPSTGVHISSFFITKRPRGMAEKIIRISRNDWCFAATSTGSVGGVPRISQRMPTSRRADPMTQWQKLWQAA